MFEDGEAAIAFVQQLDADDGLGGRRTPSSASSSTTLAAMLSALRNACSKFLFARNVERGVGRGCRICFSQIAKLLGMNQG